MHLNLLRFNLQRTNQQQITFLGRNQIVRLTFSAHDIFTCWMIRSKLEKLFLFMFVF